MNEIPDALYRRALRRDSSRSAIWVGAAILMLIAATSLYIGRAGEKNETAVTVATNNAAANPTNTSEKTTETKSMSDTELRKKLTPEQYHVTRENGTEPPFHNAYWDNHKPGIYVDLISGEALFASTDKFESGTGWPSFTKPIDPAHVVEKTDQTLFMERRKSAPKKATPISVTFLTTVHNRPACVIASIPRLCASSRRKDARGRLRPVSLSLRQDGEEIGASLA